MFVAASPSHAVVPSHMPFSDPMWVSDECACVDLSEYVVSSRDPPDSSELAEFEVQMAELVPNNHGDRLRPWTMASKAQNPTEWAVVAAAVLSTVAGLRVGEMAGIKVRGRDGIRGTITFWDEKVNRGAYSRRVVPWALRWLRFLHWWAICKLGRTLHDTIFSEPR